MEFNQLQQLVKSNARAIESLAAIISKLTHDIEEMKDLQAGAAAERTELRTATLKINNLLSSLNSDRPTFF